MKTSTLLVIAGALLFSGCFLDTVVDCRNLCERYQTCVDPETDISSCTSRCETRVDEGEDDAADDCDACLDDNPECATAVTLCAGSCGPLLAP